MSVVTFTPPVVTTRLLPKDEYVRLAHTPLAVLIGQPNDHVEVLVVEQDGEIVGCWSILSIVHVEGIWLSEPLRKTPRGVRAIWDGMRNLCASLGVIDVLTMALDDDHYTQRLLAHAHATQVPGRLYRLPMMRTS